MDRNWEQQLRDKMSQYTRPEPDGLWESILGQMDMAEAQPTVSTEKKKRMALVIPLAATVTAAAAVSAIFMLQRDQVPAMPHMMEPHTIIADAGPSLHTGIQSAGDLYLQERESRDLTGTDIETGEVPYTEETPGSSGDTSPAKKPEKERTADKAPEQEIDRDGDMPYEYIFQDIPAEREKTKRGRRNWGRFSAGLSMSNMTGARQNFSGYSTLQPSASAFKGIPDREAISTIPGNGIMLLSKGNESNTEIRHRQPVRAGVSLRYNLTDRWGIESGLVYSYLSSSMETGNSTTYSSSTVQRLHYIGIPLKINYNILDKKFLTIYAGAGGMMEKCVSGNAKVKSSLNGHEVNESEDRVTIRPLQWSVSAEAGIQGNITDFFGIYVEPGISWHFNNGSIVSTIYNEKPLNFNLEFGLRFTFE